MKKHTSECEAEKTHWRIVSDEEIISSKLNSIQFAVPEEQGHKCKIL